MEVKLTHLRSLWAGQPCRTWFPRQTRTPSTTLKKDKEKKYLCAILLLYTHRNHNPARTGSAAEVLSVQSSFNQRQSTYSASLPLSSPLHSFNTSAYLILLLLFECVPGSLLKHSPSFAFNTRNYFYPLSVLYKITLFLALFSNNNI